MKKYIGIVLSILLTFSLSACSSGVENQNQTQISHAENYQEQGKKSTNEASNDSNAVALSDDMPEASPGQVTEAISRFTDGSGDTAYVPAEFRVSDQEGEQTISRGLVVIGPDGSEFVWVPTTVTALEVREFGSYFSGGSISDYHDETELESYQDMVRGVEKYGGFYIGRYEASKGADGLPASKRVTKDEPGQIWVQFSPQDTTKVCENLYADNDTVQGFFPWGINWDTTLQWLVDSGDKLISDINTDSTSWGNYSNDTFSKGADGSYTGCLGRGKSKQYLRPRRQQLGMDAVTLRLKLCYARRRIQSDGRLMSRKQVSCGTQRSSAGK